MTADHKFSAVAEALGGEDGGKKPKKEIDHIVHKKSHNGDHIITHHHTRPEHHPAEIHTKRGDDEMVEHMLEHAGTPNPGEAEADAGNAGGQMPPEAAATQGAAPSGQPVAGGQ